MEFAAEEAEHVDRTHVESCVADQVGPHGQKFGSGLEHDVGGDLGLVEHPVVAPEFLRLDGGQQRVEPAGEGVEDSGPGPVGEVLAQLGGRVDVVDLEERVVVADVADPVLVELAGEPFAAVDID